MPIYEYECPKCGRFDAIQKMSAPALKTHDVCGSKVRKLMSASAFALKGSGFYLTDYGGRSSAAITGKSDEKPKTECKDASSKNAACASCPGSKPAAA